MEIEITKIQKTINDVPEEADYVISINRKTHGLEGYVSNHFDAFYNLTRLEVEQLRDRINKDFPN